MVTCIHCHVEKQQTEFAKRGSEYRNTCKVCYNAQKKIWADANFEKRKTSISNYYTKKTGLLPHQRRVSCLTDEERVAQKKKSHKKDYAKNKEAYLQRAKRRNDEKHVEISTYNRFWREENKEYKKAQDSAWRGANLAKVNAYSNARRAAKLNATPSWLTAIHQAQIQEMYDVALACTVQTGIQHHVDHIHPLRGSGFTGLHVPWNLQVIPGTENLSKGCRLPFEDAHLGWGNI